VADGEHARVKPKQAPAAHRVLDRAPTQARRPHLRRRDHSELRSSELSGPHPRGWAGCFICEMVELAHPVNLPRCVLPIYRRL
jgi:hypothetical protein